MKKTFFCMVLLACSLTLSPLITHAATLFSDNFPSNPVSSSNWSLPTWSQNCNVSYIGRTQFISSNTYPPQYITYPTVNPIGTANITLQTYNPSSGASFWANEIFSNSSFSLPSQGLDIKVNAEMNTTQPGIVGGLFLYGLKPGQNETSNPCGSLHDEIDFELLTNPANANQTQVQTNIYSNESAGAGNPTFVNYPSGAAININTYHTYEIQWLPNKVIWLVDGIVVRTDTNPSDMPVGPMNLYFNMWAPDGGWPQAYNSSFVSTSNQSNNQTYTMLVNSVSVAPIPVLTTINLSPLTANLLVGSSTQQITATTLDQNNNPISATLTWSSSSTTVATVNSSGLVTPVGVGTANITATSGSVTSTAPAVITVTKPAPVLKTITLSPLTASLTVGGATQQITATTLDQYSNPITTTLTWTSSNTAVATVNSSGLVTPVSAGTANISATSGSITSTAPSVITVTAVSNPKINITSTPLVGQSGNAAGNVTGISPSNYSQYAVALYINVYGQWWNKPFWNAATTTIQSDGTWSASVTTGGMDQWANQIVAYLVPSSLTVPQCGNGTCTPALSTLSSYPSASVTRLVPMTITLSPLSVSLVAGGAGQQITPSLLDQNNNPITVLPALNWQSSDYTVANVSSTGFVTPVGVGTAKIYAGAGSIANTTSTVVTVTQWLLDLNQIPFVTESKSYYSGAAVASMILNYQRSAIGSSTLSQDQVYTDGSAHGTVSGTGSELNAVGMQSALGDLDPYDGTGMTVAQKASTGYNYDVESYPNNSTGLNNYTNDIVHWMAWPVPKQNWWLAGPLTSTPNTPAAIPSGSYSNWMLVYGAAANESPNTWSNLLNYNATTNSPFITPSNLVVAGFWFINPSKSPTDPGFNFYATAADAQSTYFKPLVSGDSYNGTYVQIAEPSKVLDNTKIEVANLIQNGDTSNLQDIVSDDDAISQIDSDNAPDFYTPKNNPSASAIAKSKTRASSFKKINWNNVIDSHLLGDTTFQKSFKGTSAEMPYKVKRTDTGETYFLVPFGQNKRNASVILMVDGKTGSFEQATWTKSSQTYLQVGMSKAIKLAKVKNQDVTSAQLEWEPNKYSDSPYMPYWDIQTKSGNTYVTQDEKIYTK